MTVNRRFEFTREPIILQLQCRLIIDTKNARLARHSALSVPRLTWKPIGLTPLTQSNISVEIRTLFVVLRENLLKSLRGTPTPLTRTLTVVIKVRITKLRGLLPSPPLPEILDRSLSLHVVPLVVILTLKSPGRKETTTMTIRMLTGNVMAHLRSTVDEVVLSVLLEIIRLVVLSVALQVGAEATVLVNTLTALNLAIEGSFPRMKRHVISEMTTETIRTTVLTTINPTLHPPKTVLTLSFIPTLTEIRNSTRKNAKNRPSIILAPSISAVSEQLSLFLRIFPV